MAVALLTVGGCKKQAAVSSMVPATNPMVTVASLVPAATDLLVGMNAGIRIVAVSTYDRQRPDLSAMPAAGDYQTVDWEQLALLHPTVLITDTRPDRLPAGFTQRAAALKITPINIAVDQLDDVFTALQKLGNALDMPDQSRMAQQQLHARLDAVSGQTAGLPRVSTLIVLNESASAIAGPDTYLDSLLKIAGGSNAAAGLGSRYPQIDREMLLSLKPQAIIQLLPSASVQVKQQAAQNWAQLRQIPAVASGRVYVIDNWYALLPGWHVADLAEQFAQCLHPLTTTQP